MIQRIIATTPERSGKPRETTSSYFWRQTRKNATLLLFLLPAVLIVIVFNYLPMYGVLMAFKDFRPAQGIWGSRWIGLEHFIRFFRSYQFENILGNTLFLSVVGLIARFPAPILLALMLNQMRNASYRRVAQTVTYLPNFISTVVFCGMILVFLSPSVGLYGNILRLLGVDSPPNILLNKSAFRWIYILSGIWQHTGWDSIIYLAALSSVDLALYEACTIDGANRLQKIWHVDVPAVTPTAVILLILSAGKIMSVGFEKVYLLQNTSNLPTSEIISTYVYKLGIQQAEYGFSSAVGLFNSAINLVMLLLVNTASKKLSDSSLW